MKQDPGVLGTVRPEAPSVWRIPRLGRPEPSPARSGRIFLIAVLSLSALSWCAVVGLCVVSVEMIEACLAIFGIPTW